MNNNKYSIGTVSQETEMSIKRIRYLQEKGFLNDNRVVCGTIAYRNFSDEDIRKIKAIKKYQDEGYTLTKAVEKAEQEINNNNDMEVLEDENL